MSLSAKKSDMMYGGERSRVSDRVHVTSYDEVYEGEEGEEDRTTFCIKEREKIYEQTVTTGARANSTGTPNAPAVSSVG